MIFELKTKCLSIFNITIEDNPPLLFNVTSSDIERGEMIFDLPDDIISSMLYDVCSVNAMISGSNHIGQVHQLIFNLLQIVVLYILTHICIHTL